MKSPLRTPSSGGSAHHVSRFVACSRYAAGAAIAALLFVGAPRVAQAQFGTNLLQNPGAEAGPGSVSGNDVETIPNWDNTGTSFTAAQYGSSSGVTADEGPAGDGANYFAGGPSNSSSQVQQMLHLSFGGPEIASGGVTYSLSGYFGGYSNQGDFATLTAELFNGTTSVGTVTIGNVSPADRGNATGMIFREAMGSLPNNVTDVLFTLSSTRTDGSYNDGSADNLSFVLTAPNMTTTPEPGSLALLGTGLVGLAPMVRRKRR